jgi:hypothetical protein
VYAGWDESGEAGLGEVRFAARRVRWRGERLEMSTLRVVHQTAMSTPVTTAKAAQMAMISTLKADMVSTFPS